MEFKLNESQIERLKKWKESIKAEHGEYGHYKYAFSPNGIGMEVMVYSEVAQKFLDLSEPDKW